MNLYFWYSFRYDLCIGTSDKGQPIQEIENESLKFYHALIVFGGVLGIDQALKNDEQLKIGDPALLFDFYLNTIPEQGELIFLCLHSYL
jgi:methyltransferase